MVYGALVLHSAGTGDGKAFLQGINGRMLADDGFGLLCNNLFDQRRNILKMIIKRISVDAAILHNITHADFGKRALIEQLDKRSLDCASCKIRHGSNSFLSSIAVILPYRY